MSHKWSISIILLVSIILLIFVPTGYAAFSNSLKVSFIDVGQGDSALIQGADGFDVLIDGGRSSAGPTVVAYLREQGVDDIEVMVATHAHSDHIGGLIDVLKLDDIPVESVFYNGYPGDTTTWSNFVTAVTNEGLTLTSAQYPQSFIWGVTSVNILNPISGLVNPEQNDASVVILLDHNDTEFLFTGDIETSVESDILSRGSNVAAEILKVSHHGSKYASSADFLTAVQPAEAVISVGSNPYGHPTDETIARLIEVGARIWRTDESGTIMVASDGETYNVISQNDFVYLPIILSFDQEPPPPSCDPAYPDFCIHPPPPDLDCSDISQINFTVLPPDPHNFDGDGDGLGCETPQGDCDPAYPSVCILPPPPDLDCSDIPHTNFIVLPPDPHNFDGDGDGVGCETPKGDCDPSYPTVCIPPPPPDLDCGEITYRNFTVLPPDPHRFDGDGDGIGCESG